MNRLLLPSLILFVVLSASLAYANNPPVADAGPDIHMYLGEATLLDGSAWDPDGDPIVWWEWTIESRPAGSMEELSDPNRPNPVFTPDLVGQYAFSLAVSDGTDESLPDTCVLAVDFNLPPVAIATAEPESGCVPLLVQFDGTQSYDPEGRPLRYSWDFGECCDYPEEPLAVHEYDRAGTYNACLVVKDDVGQYDYIYLTIQVDYGPSQVESSTWGRIKALFE